ncbi:MAG TPA: 3-methyladenine DNA glycosylase [Nocardioides sp.]|nr:3-methyladenine DNA glycosylase [Nocardioides sp.]
MDAPRVSTSPTDESPATSPTSSPDAEAHRTRLAPYVEPHLERRRLGVPHPVHDFLFTYYSFSPTKLLAWEPGWPVSGSTDLLEKRRGLVVSTLELLRATAGRPPAFACFGLHEWAMVHRTDETRHPLPLRLGATRTDAVVASHRIACSHFDAYRFFTPSAAPLNRLRPGPDDRPAYEQPGCLHATMDLYKHAFRLWPLIGSDLVADCFELAWDVRNVDMRAAPYDMTGITLDPTGEPWSPIRIETSEGKQEYAACQRRFLERSTPLRTRLTENCERLLGAGGANP